MYVAVWSAAGDAAVVLRPTARDDLDFVLAAEADPDTEPYIGGWSRELHEQAMFDPGQAHIIIERGERIGFVILVGIGTPNRSIELRRIVVTRKGAGLGRRALELLLEHVFGVLGAHRVWLDVKVHNERARRAYHAAGFVEEGILREAIASGDGYESLLLMSVLESEWAAR